MQGTDQFRAHSCCICRVSPSRFEPEQYWLDHSVDSGNGFITGCLWAEAWKIEYHWALCFQFKKFCCNMRETVVGFPCWRVFPFSISNLFHSTNWISNNSIISYTNDRGLSYTVSLRPKTQNILSTSDTCHMEVFQSDYKFRAPLILYIDLTAC